MRLLSAWLLILLDGMQLSTVCRIQRNYSGDEWSLLGAIGIHLTLTLNPNPKPNPIGSYTVYM